MTALGRLECTLNQSFNHAIVQKQYQHLPLLLPSPTIFEKKGFEGLCGTYVCVPVCGMCVSVWHMYVCVCVVRVCVPSLLQQQLLQDLKEDQHFVFRSCPKVIRVTSTSSPRLEQCEVGVGYLQTTVLFHHCFKDSNYHYHICCPHIQAAPTRSICSLVDLSWCYSEVLIIKL